MAVDTLIKGGLIVDGTGRKAYVGDVAIKGGKIAALGTVRESAGRVIDAAGLAVAPGFWDAHTHYDAQLLWDPIATSSCWHGVTTVVMGNCGFTMAPVRPGDEDWVLRMLARVEGMHAEALGRTLPWAWRTFGEYLDTLDRRLGVNVVSQVGHTAVRRYVMGKEASDREATPEEIARMREVLARSLKEGGMGFTSSRVTNHWDGDGLPVPSRLATVEEYLDVIQELRAIHAGWVQAATDFNRHRLAEVARISGRPVSWNMIQPRPDRPDSWKGQLERMLEMRSEGVPFFALGQVHSVDFEFTFANTNVFDRWATWQKTLIMPMTDRLTALRDSRLRDILREEMKTEPSPRNRFDWARVILVKSTTGRHARFERRDMVSMGKELGKHPLDAALDIALDEELSSQFRVLDPRQMSEEVMLAILKTPHVIPGMSDAGAHLITEVNTAFPTALLGHWVREKGAMTLEEAVRMLAAVPAEEGHFTDRGRLEPGLAADVTIFDPQTVAPGERTFVNDLPGGHPRLVQYAKGVEYTLVNGVVTLERGKPTGDLGGKTLRSGAYVG